jgi:hypothetical protein
MLNPEIEDYSELEKLLDGNNEQGSSIDVLEANEDNICWRENLDDCALAELLSVRSTATLRVLSACSPPAPIV